MSRLQKLFIFVCFLLGIVFFFPMASLEHRLSEALSKSTRSDIRIVSPKLGFGFETGLFAGGIFAIRAEQISITPAQSSETLVCNNVVLSPKFLALIILRLQAALRCELGSGKSPILAVIKTPLFDPNNPTAEIEFESISLKEIGAMANTQSLSGIVSGFANISNLTQAPQNVSATWDVTLQNLNTPSFNSNFGSLPPLSFSTGHLVGSYENQKIKFSSFKIGANNKDSLVTELQIELGFRGNNVTSGYIQGNLKSTEDFDHSVSSIVNMNQVFGTPRTDGQRRFKKTIQGNVLSLLAPPEPHP